MGRIEDVFTLPPDLPAPLDDGAAAHLTGSAVAPVVLTATSGDAVNLAGLQGRTIVYCYPRTGLPDQDPPAGWDQIPGARGCTPQSCAFRDQHDEFRTLRVHVFGLSVQDTEYQREAAARLHLPFPLLSDERFEFASAMRLPMFEIASMRLLKRLTLVIRDGVVEHVFYPVFPPDRNAQEVLHWLAGRLGDEARA